MTHYVVDGQTRVSRNVHGTAKRIFWQGIHGSLLVAIREALANAMTYIHKARVPYEDRKIWISIIQNKDGMLDLAIEDPGSGIMDWVKFRDMGHSLEDPEYLENIKDPEFISFFGIGINSYVNPSKDLTAQFYTVTENEEGLRRGFIATLQADDKTGDIFFYDPPQWLDSKYVLDHRGTKIIIRNLKKDVSKREIINYVSEVFALKLKDYKVFIHDNRKDNEGQWTRIQPSDVFPHDQMDHMFDLSDGSQVRGDIRHIAEDNIRDARIRICVRRVKMDDIECARLARGIITVDSLRLRYKPDRDKLDTDTEMYEELDSKLSDWLEEHGFGLPQPKTDKKIKNEDMLEDISSDLIDVLSEVNPDVALLLSGSYDATGRVGIVENDPNRQQTGDGSQVIKLTNQKRIVTDQQQNGKLKRAKKKKKLKKKRKQKIGGPKVHHGWKNGGKNTVYISEDANPQNNEGRIRPRIPTETDPFGPRTNPVMPLVRDHETGQLVFRLTTQNPTSNLIIEAGPQNANRILPFYAKSITDFVATQEAYDWAQASKLMEDLMRGLYERRTSDEAEGSQ